MEPVSEHYCEPCNAAYPLRETLFSCPNCDRPLNVRHHFDRLDAKPSDTWRKTFDDRRINAQHHQGSGVWRFREWVMPELPQGHIITAGEGATPLTTLPSSQGRKLQVKQCGHSLTGSFKDLGMTVLVSWAHHLKETGTTVPAVACASSGDTSAALAAYAARAGLRALILLPKGKVSASQLVQPLAHGARVVAIDGDFDDCMVAVQRLCQEEGVYLANSKNGLRLEGQKTVAFEIAQDRGWTVPDWVAIPSGNLGNVAALAKGFQTLVDMGVTNRIPRILCAQAEAANPFAQSFDNGFQERVRVTASPTQASAIRIGNPVSYDRAVAAIKATNGIVVSVSEAALSTKAASVNQQGLFVCPHTAVALAAVDQLILQDTIAQSDEVVVVSTAHGLKFTEFQQAVVGNSVPGVDALDANAPIEVGNDYNTVRDAALS